MPKEGNELKLERLLAMVMMLLNKRRMTASELAEHFEVSLRTVYRDLEAINAAGIPIVAFPGTKGGFEIMESFTIDRQYLTLQELVAVVAALKGVHSTTEDRQIAHLLEKVNALVAGAGSKAAASHLHPVIYDFHAWGSTSSIRGKISHWKTAIEQHKQTAITYTTMHGETQERTIEPITLIVKGYVWYVYGYCLLRQDYRLFRLSRITEMNILPQTFSPHDVSVDKLEWADEWDKGEQALLLLRFHPRVQVRAVDMFEPEQIERGEDGYLFVRTKVKLDEWLYGMLLSFGDDLCVVEPSPVRERMRETAKKMLSMYEKS